LSIDRGLGDLEKPVCLFLLASPFPASIIRGNVMESRGSFRERAVCCGEILKVGGEGSGFPLFVILNPLHPKFIYSLNKTLKQHEHD